MTEPDPHILTRRALREAALRAAEAAPAPIARHARRAGIGKRMAVAAAGAMILVAGASVATAAALTAPALTAPPLTASATSPEVSATAAPAPAPTPAEEVSARILALPPEGLPTPEQSTGVADAGTLCEDPALTAALAAGDDAATIAATGGPEAFRAAVAAGTAPCIRLDDSARVWVVVNKQRPYAPMDAVPAPLVQPEAVRSLVGSDLRQDAAGALTALVRAAADAGAGEVALESGYRSFTTQRSTYAGHVADRGVEGADLVSARPGYSEHQSGLTVDVVPCAESCATIDDLAASPQGAWLAEHAWEYGWIVRYTEGRTDVTGYAPEPWHLRYIGPELARAYHDGGWTTLEEFFGLPPAPGYAE